MCLVYAVWAIWFPVPLSLALWHAPWWWGRNTGTCPVWLCDLLNAVVASSYRHAAISYLSGMDLPGNVCGDKEKCTPVMCCVPFGLLSNQLTASLNWVKGCGSFHLSADTCAPDYMNQDNNNKELQHLNACTFSVVLATGHEEENNWRCWKWFLLLRPMELKTIIKLVAESSWGFPSSPQKKNREAFSLTCS